MIVPTIPPSPLDMKQWCIDVLSAVQAASGRQETTTLRNWLNECRDAIADPDAHFDTSCTPQEFVSLESKLNVALRKALDATKDKTLLNKVKREDQLLSLIHI